jgi:hypothetical protein
MANPVNFNPSKSKREAKAARRSRRAKRKAAARAAEVRAEKSRALAHNREVVRSRAEALEWSEGSAERGRLRTDALSRYAAGRPAPAGLEEVYAEIVRDAVEDEYGDAEAFRAGWVDTDKFGINSSDWGEDEEDYLDLHGHNIRNPRKKTKTYWRSEGGDLYSSRRGASRPGPDWVASLEPTQAAIKQYGYVRAKIRANKR